MIHFHDGDQIPVTSQHIENGGVFERDNPISKAILEYFGNPKGIIVDVDVEEQAINIFQKGVGLIKHISTNAHVEKWVSDHFSCNVVDPITLRISISEKAIGANTTWVGIDFSTQQKVFMPLEHRLYLKNKLQSAMNSVCSVILSLGAIEDIDGDIASTEYIPNFMQDRLVDLENANEILKYATHQFENAIEKGNRYGVESVEELAKLINGGQPDAK